MSTSYRENVKQINGFSEETVGMERVNTARCGLSALRGPGDVDTSNEYRSIFNLWSKCMLIANGSTLSLPLAKVTHLQYHLVAGEGKCIQFAHSNCETDRSTFLCTDVYKIWL
jgi:hypothetical protein